MQGPGGGLQTRGPLLLPGMMLGGGCGQQLAYWIVHGRPEKDMHGYDIRQVPPGPVGGQAALEWDSGGDGLLAKLCPTLVTPWTVALQAPLSMGFSRQEYWSGWPFPSPGDLPDPGIEPGSPALWQILYRLSYKGSC